MDDRAVLIHPSPRKRTVGCWRLKMEVVGNVLSGVKTLYDSTNKANLSGAIDVVVVYQVSANVTLTWLEAKIN